MRLSVGVFSADGASSRVTQAANLDPHEAGRQAADQLIADGAAKYALDRNLAALEDLVGRVSVLKDDLPQVARLRFSPVLASPEGVTVLQAEVDVANAAGRTDSARRALRGS